MAKVSARGCFELARTSESEWKDISGGAENQFSRQSYILRSDGAILRKISFKVVYPTQGNAYSSNTSVFGKITLDRSEWLTFFKRFAERRNYQVA